MGNRVLSEIRPIDILKVLQEIETRGCYETVQCVLCFGSSLCLFQTST